MNPLAFWERKISAAEVSLCFVLGRLFEAGFIDSSESFASLTNCIFKLWSNTTLKLGAASLYFLSVDGHAARFSLQFCHRMTSRHKDWNKCISAFFISTSRKAFLWAFLCQTSLFFCFFDATLVPNNFTDKRSCVSSCVSKFQELDCHLSWMFDECRKWEIRGTNICVFNNLVVYIYIKKTKKEATVEMWNFSLRFFRQISPASQSKLPH